MDLHSVTAKGVRYADRRRVGRGPGSGLGKTSGRGHKGWGQRSGASRRPGYEGGQMPIYRRVPKRGFTNARFHTAYTVINVDDLSSFADGTTVDLEAVLTAGLTSRVSGFFKVLGNGKLERKLTVRAQKFTASAIEKIHAAGGTAVVLDAQGREAPAEGGDAALADGAKNPLAQGRKAPRARARGTKTPPTDGGDAPPAKA